MSGVIVKTDFILVNTILAFILVNTSVYENKYHGWYQELFTKAETYLYGFDVSIIHDTPQRCRKLSDICEQRPVLNGAWNHTY